MKIPRLPLALLFAMCATALFQSSADGESHNSLRINSPFSGGNQQREEQVAKPEKKNPSSKIHVDGNYELRGVLIAGGVKMFNIYTVSNSKFQWVRQGDASTGIFVDSFDEGEKTLYFHTREGENHSIRLKNTPHDLKRSGIVVE
jgi:hypothetical protein